MAKKNDPKVLRDGSVLLVAQGGPYDGMKFRDYGDHALTFPNGVRYTADVTLGRWVYDG